MIVRALLSRLTRLLPPPRVIRDREGGSAYLSRWYIAGRGKDYDGGAKDIAAPGLLGRLPFNVFLHRFHRSDDDGALHNHPWSWSVSFILAGGYSEERRVGDEVVRREVRPWRINVIRRDDFHRVDLLEHDAWTIFVASPKVGTWHFWDRGTKQRAHWRAFVDWKRGARADAGWAPDSVEAAG